MKHAVEINESFEKAKQELSGQISKACDDLIFTKNKIVRLEIPVESVDILSWVQAQEENKKLYWSSRDGALEVGGIGITYALHGARFIDYDAIFTELERYLTPEQNKIKFFGGIAFHSNSVDKNWESFGTYRFILPQFEVVRKENQTFFACNLFGESLNKETIINNLHALQFDGVKKNEKPPSPLSRSDFPSKEQFIKSAKHVLESIHAQNISKVVLARQSQFKFSENLNAFSLLTELKKISNDCFHFCFQVEDNAAFVGASPERLYKRINRSIQTEAIAGTRPRAQNLHDDERLKNDLKNSTKDKHEHKFVVDAIEQALKNFCDNTQSSGEMNLLSLQSGHHLLTSLTGKLLRDVDDAMLLKALHPTPAVCGIPVEKALKTIFAEEPFKRGWYAGPIGYVGFEESEFAVAIRSGLVLDKALSIFAGAGIVEGSNPDDEWDEIETKVSSFLKIFENGLF